jgi:adhesin transport system membrane fusion protein
MNAAQLERPPLAARLTIAVVVLLIASFVAWAAFAYVDELARGDGKVIPVSKTQVIQSSEPGVVQEIAVRVGQVVKRGDLLLRLDNTGSAASLGESEAKAQSLRAKVARLDLELSGDETIETACPAELQAATPAACANESAVLLARRANLGNRRAVLEQRAMQRELELQEARANIAQLTEVITAMTRERDAIEPLVRRKLHAETNLLRVERELAQQRGQLTVAEAGVDRIQAGIDEARIQVRELASQFRQEVNDEKTATLSELSILDQTIRGASDRVRRTDIRSPVDGIINTLEVNTIGAYVQPGAVVGGVVPTADTLLVEARISPRDVAFVQRGQPALVKITAYDFAIYGGVDGQVANISADSLVDQESGTTYYQVLVQTDSAAIVKDGREHAIMPGMVASVEIMTGSKTVLDYLLKPINRARSEAMTER